MIKTELKAERVVNAIIALNDLLKNYPGINQGHHLFEHVENLLSYTKEKKYVFEVLFLDKPDEEGLKKIATFFNLDEEATRGLKNHLETNNSSSGVFQVDQPLKTILAKIKFYTAENIPTRTTGQYIPAIKFIFWFQKEPPLAQDVEMIQFRLEAEGGLSLLFSQNPVVGLSSINDFRIISKNLSVIEPLKYTDWLLQEKLADNLDLLKAQSIVKSLEKLSVAFSQFLDQEENDIRTKKFGTQQEVNNLKQQEKVSLRDSFQRLKTDLQRDFMDFEKGINDRISSQNRMQEGSLLSKTEAMINGITGFEKAEFGSRVQLSLSKTFKQELLDLLKSSCEKQINQDIFSFKDFVEQSTETVRKNISGNQMEFTYYPKVYFNSQQLSNMLEDLFIINKEYVTEKKKLQKMDYFRAATKPLMIVSSVSMAVAAISSGKISVMKFINGGNKGFTFTTFLYGSVMLGVIGYSFYSFFKSNKEAEEQLHDQELKKMQESLKAEARSMLKRFIDEWSRMVITQTREEMNNLIQNLEYSFSEHGENQKNKLADSQRDIQRRMQGLEQRERAHSTTVKSREQYVKAISQLNGEINQVFMQSTYES
jgi:hypothetical protein